MVSNVLSRNTLFRVVVPVYLIKLKNKKYIVFAISVNKYSDLQRKDLLVKNVLMTDQSVL